MDTQAQVKKIVEQADRARERCFFFCSATHHLKDNEELHYPAVLQTISDFMFMVLKDIDSLKFQVRELGEESDHELDLTE